MKKKNKTSFEEAAIAAVDSGFKAFMEYLMKEAKKAEPPLKKLERFLEENNYIEKKKE